MSYRPYIFPASASGPQPGPRQREIYEQLKIINYARRSLKM
jgi:hypothetical protein